MAPHLEWLAENWPGFLSVQPNAGLPELVDGQTRYPLGPQELAGWAERFLIEDGVNILGGCCATTPAHIAALDAILRKRAGEDGRDGARPAPKQRQASWVRSEEHTSELRSLMRNPYAVFCLKTIRTY